jgi:hypothetical protein
MEIKTLFLIIFDISGYTRFTRKHDRQIMRAQKIVGELLSTIVTTAAPPLTLHEITGDAVSFHVESNGGPLQAKHIWDQVNTVFVAFREAERKLLGADPDFSAGLPGSRLKLKAVLHHCDAVVTDFHGFTRVAGPGIILAHRLLKNSIEADEYVIITPSFHSLADDLIPARGVWQEELCDGFGAVCILVCYPREPQPAHSVSTRPRSERGSHTEAPPSPLVSRLLNRYLFGFPPRKHEGTQDHNRGRNSGDVCCLHRGSTYGGESDLIIHCNCIAL